MVVGDALNTAAVEFLSELVVGSSLIERNLQLGSNVLYQSRDLRAA